VFPALARGGVYYYMLAPDSLLDYANMTAR
jgi:hypothetical protein